MKGWLLGQKKKNQKPQEKGGGKERCGVLGIEDPLDNCALKKREGGKRESGTNFYKGVG